MRNKKPKNESERAKNQRKKNMEKNVERFCVHVNADCKKNETPKITKK